MLARIALFCAIFAAAAPLVAQFNKSVCPELTILSPPRNNYWPGDTVTFVLDSKDISSYDELDIRWKVENGAIVEGERTRAVKTLIKEYGVTITATATMSGLPAQCTNSISASIQVERKPDYESLYHFAVSSKNDSTLFTIDNFLYQLMDKDYKGYVGLFLIPFESKKSKKSANELLKMILKQALLRKFDKTRLVFMLGPWDSEYASAYRFPGHVPGDFICNDCRIVYGKDLDWNFKTTK
jgi:hypothetical protein